MNIKPKIRNAALVGALAAVAASAWAMNDSFSGSPYKPDDNISMQQPAVQQPADMTPVDAAATNGSLSPNESVVTTPETRDIKATPVEDRSVAQPPITVETRRLSEDERIQAQVMDKLASNENLSGKIGVEAHDSVVTLSGWTSTSGQAWRAGNAARSITGVKYVQNEIRPRVGGSI